MDNFHSYALVTLYLLGGLFLVSPAILYWNIYNQGYYDGFDEGEDHNAQMHEEARRARVAWERQELEREMDALAEATAACLERCEAAGFPSLNAFYARDRSRCMCQHPHPTDDIHGFFFLVGED